MLKRLLLPSMALAAMTSVAVAETLPAPSSQSAGPVQLTDVQLDQLNAGQRNNNQVNRQRCDFAFACVQNNQQTFSGDNRGGDAVVVGF